MKALLFPHWETDEFPVKIVDEVGNPITGAEVTVAQKTVVTDNNGDFTIDLPRELII